MAYCPEQEEIRITMWVNRLSDRRAYEKNNFLVYLILFL